MEDTLNVILYGKDLNSNIKNLEFILKIKVIQKGKETYSLWRGKLEKKMRRMGERNIAKIFELFSCISLIILFTELF